MTTAKHLQDLTDTMHAAEAIKTAAGAAVRAAMTVWSATAKGSPEYAAAYASHTTASIALEAAKCAWHVTADAVQAAKATPAKRTTRAASGGRTIHTVSNKSWTEY